MMQTLPSPQPPGRTPFTVHCGECRHEWVAAWLPMKARAFARVAKGAGCPMCGASPARVFCGSAPEAASE
jgi:hypothetical protein